ncbi:electron transfer flavoprotein subunit beta/FixA family protein [Candidatus Korarchaeum cryptofilum]|uniref:electron transfer flavoprotein subunit beta/FixA family protein n=1 Tax=Candidatus Korarchaeum cryptofilum TaxID=498846 RepID=UPI0006960BD6|nr:electron transfer flavoprotein subunit beta/FixA family protein [Candidatus Korarchaeum cryptofilum]
MALEVVVCVKLAYDETQIPIEGDKLLLEKAPVKVSDIDKNAIEEAVRIKEKFGGSVTVISVVTGPYDETILNEALAMGADKAFIVEGIGGTNPARTAKAIAEVIRKMGIKYDLILCGEGSSDQYSCAVAPMLAEYLSIPSITFAGKLEIEGNVIRGERLLETGYELVETELPAVVSVTSEINEPRIPSVLQIMKAGKKEKISVKSSDLNLEAPNVDLVEVKAYVRERLRKKFEGNLEPALREVISVLREKGVIS